MKTIFPFFIILIISLTSLAQNVLSDVTIAGKSGGEITKEELLNSNGLESSSPTHHVEGFNLNVLYKVWGKNTDSTFFYTQPGNEKDTFALAMSYTSNNNQLTYAMKERIRMMPTGSHLDFAEIHCRPDYKASHFVPPLSFTLK